MKIDPRLIALAAMLPPPPKVQPCACGSHRVGILESFYPLPYIRMKCDACGLCGPTANDRAAATDAWNAMCSEIVKGRSD